MSGCHWARNVIAHIKKQADALRMRVDRHTLELSLSVLKIFDLVFGGNDMCT